MLTPHHCYMDTNHIIFPTSHVNTPAVSTGASADSTIAVWTQTTALPIPHTKTPQASYSHNKSSLPPPLLCEHKPQHCHTSYEHATSQLLSEQEFHSHHHCCNTSYEHATSQLLSEQEFTPTTIDVWTQTAALFIPTQCSLIWLFCRYMTSDHSNAISSQSNPAQSQHHGECISFSPPQFSVNTKHSVTSTFCTSPSHYQSIPVSVLAPSSFQ